MSELGDLIEDWDIEEPFGGYSPKAKSSPLLDCPPFLGSGCYCLCRDGKVIYVGKAIKLLIRIYAHWNSMERVKAGKEASKGTKGIVFTHVKIQTCSLSELDMLESQLIARFKPKYNERKVPKGKVTLEQIGFDFSRFGLAKVVETPVYRRRL